LTLGEDRRVRLVRDHKRVVAMEEVTGVADFVRHRRERRVPGSPKSTVTQFVSVGGA